MGNKLILNCTNCISSNHLQTHLQSIINNKNRIRANSISSNHSHSESNVDRKNNKLKRIELRVNRQSSVVMCIHKQLLIFKILV